MSLMIWILLAIAAVWLVVFSTFKFSCRAMEQRHRGSARTVETCAGPIEYSEAGQGPAVLFLHGTPGGSDQGLASARQFADAGYRLICPSRPGYGDTPLEVGRTPAEQADAYVALLDAFELDQVFVCGASGGGPSGTEFVLRHPERTLACVLMMPLMCGLPRSDEGIWPRVLNTIFGAGFWPWMQSSMFLRVLSRKTAPPPTSNDAEDFEYILSDPAKLAEFQQLVRVGMHAPESIRGVGSRNDIALYTKPAAHELLDFSKPLESLSRPLLLLHGDADANAPYPPAKAAAERMPGAELYTFPGGGHFVMVSRSAEFWKVTLDFLERHRESA